MLKIQGLKKSYQQTEVLKGIHIEIFAKEIVAIVGASGAGKTTFLQIAGTLNTPNEGKVFINNINPFALSAKHLAKFRNEEIGFVFQFHNLIKELNVLENICLPSYIGGNDRKKAQQAAYELMELLAITHKAASFPNHLSGGEAQRVAIARALINKPSIVYADEPSGNLDSKNAQNIYELFHKLRKETGRTFVIVTHHKEFASMADRSFEMKDGLLHIHKA